MTGGSIKSNVSAILPESSEKVPSNMHKMGADQPALVEYCPGLCSPFIHSVVTQFDVGLTCDQEVTGSIPTGTGSICS